MISWDAHAILDVFQEGRREILYILYIVYLSLFTVPGISFSLTFWLLQVSRIFSRQVFFVYLLILCCVCKISICCLVSHFVCCVVPVLCCFWLPDDIKSSSLCLSPWSLGQGIHLNYFQESYIMFYLLYLHFYKKIWHFTGITGSHLVPVASGEGCKGIRR